MYGAGAVYSEVRTAGDMRREHFTEERGFLYAETFPHAGAPQYCGAPVLARNRLFFAPASACCRPFRAAGRRFLCCDCFCDTPCAEDVYRNGLILGGAVLRRVTREGCDCFCCFACMRCGATAAARPFLRSVSFRRFRKRNSGEKFAATDDLDEKLCTQKKFIKNS